MVQTDDTETKRTEKRPLIGISYFEDRGNPMKHRLFDRIREWAELILLNPEKRHPDLPEMGLDLYHMARWSPEAYSDFELAYETGIPTINSYDGAKITEDRVASARIAAAHGLPFIEFEYGTADEITLTPPVLIKPRHELGSNGHDFRLVFSGEVAFDDERMVERYIVPSRSFKVFQVGDYIRATERRAEGDPFKEVEMSKHFVDFTNEVASLFDLALFEMDLLVHKSYYMIDINPVVSFEGADDGIKLYEQLLRTACESS